MNILEPKNQEQMQQLRLLPKVKTRTDSIVFYLWIALAKKAFGVSSKAIPTTPVLLEIVLSLYPFKSLNASLQALLPPNTGPEF